jgi:hypothetical protein
MADGMWYLPSFVSNVAVYNVNVYKVNVYGVTVYNVMHRHLAVSMLVTLTSRIRFSQERAGAAARRYL